MQRSGSYHLAGPVLEAGSTFVPSFSKDTAALLQKQGCTFVRGEKQWNRQVIVVTYPNGSTRQKVSTPTTGCRDLIILPNGFEVLEVQDESGRCRGLSLDQPV
jgi:hypothetical protein